MYKTRLVGRCDTLQGEGTVGRWRLGEGGGHSCPTALCWNVFKRIFLGGGGGVVEGKNQLYCIQTARIHYR